jgi:hypothetical protein
MSTVKSEPITTHGRFSYNRIAAVMAWLIGLFFTYLFLSRLMPAAGMVVALVIAAVIQILLTLVERPLWRLLSRRKGGRFMFIAIIATFCDAAVNAGGMYPYVPRISNTDVGKMLIEVFQLNPTMSASAAMGIAFFLGLLAAGAPEALWEYD